MGHSDSIPVVDLTTPHRAFAQAFGRGLEEFGFVSVVGHGIPAELLQQARFVAAQVFALPLEAKLRCESPETGHHLGYTPFRMERAAGSKTPDLKEFWHVVRQGTRGSRNIWPSEVPGFKHVMLDLFSRLDSLSVTIMAGLAEYLVLPSDHFTRMMRNGDSVLRVIHYPEITGRVRGMRSAPHEDINLATLLVAAEKPGLMIKTRKGEWIRVQNPPDAIIVNSGDMLKMHTFDRIPSTTHQVENPPEPDGARYSFPFFVHPRPGVPLVTAGAYKLHRLRENGVA